MSSHLRSLALMHPSVTAFVIREDRQKRIQEMFGFPQEFVGHLRSLFDRHLFLVSKMLYLWMKGSTAHHVGLERDLSTWRPNKDQAIKSMLELLGEDPDKTSEEDFLKLLDDRKFETLLNSLPRDGGGEAGIGKLSVASEEFFKKVKKERIRNNPDHEKVILRRDDGSYWLDLGRWRCDDEASEMKHCGIAQTEDATLLSFRDRKNRSLITVEYNKEHKLFVQALGRMNNDLDDAQKKDLQGALSVHGRSEPCELDLRRHEEDRPCRGFVSTGSC